MLTLDAIRRALATHEPEHVAIAEPRRAAVALVLHEAPSGPELLFIERAEREGDPWSGHMAFPGGRVDASDRGLAEAAERETREEVGLDLERAARLGRLGDLHGSSPSERPLVISAFVYAIPAPTPLTPNHEVREALWVPVRALLEPERQVAYEYAWRGNGASFPGILVGMPGRHVVWGLTYRFVEKLFATLGTTLPGGRE